MTERSKSKYAFTVSPEDGEVLGMTLFGDRCLIATEGGVYIWEPDGYLRKLMAEQESLGADFEKVWDDNLVTLLES